MKTIICRWLSCLLIVFGSGLSEGCKKNITQEQYQTYSNNGISFFYPKHWKFSYDDEPDIYTSRGIGLQITDISTARIWVEKNKPLTSEMIINHLENELHLKSGENISNYKNEKIKISGLESNKLTWKETSIGSSNFELIVVDLNKNKAFALINLSDEDIVSESKNIEPFIDSISIN